MQQYVSGLNHSGYLSQFPVTVDQKLDLDIVEAKMRSRLSIYRLVEMGRLSVYITYL